MDLGIHLSWISGFVDDAEYHMICHRSTSNRCIRQRILDKDEKWLKSWKIPDNALISCSSFELPKFRSFKETQIPVAQTLRIDFGEAYGIGNKYRLPCRRRVESLSDGDQLQKSPLQDVWHFSRSLKRGIACPSVSGLSQKVRILEIADCMMPLPRRLTLGMFTPRGVIFDHRRVFSTSLWQSDALRASKSNPWRYIGSCSSPQHT